MRKMTTMLAAMALLAAPALYSVYLTSAIVDRGYDWQDMDWNNDGRTQLHEILAAGDIVPHRTVRGGQRCIHYFAYSTATLVRTDCEGDAEA